MGVLGDVMFITNRIYIIFLDVKRHDFVITLSISRTLTFHGHKRGKLLKR